MASATGFYFFELDSGCWMPSCLQVKTAAMSVIDILPFCTKRLSKIRHLKSRLLEFSSQINIYVIDIAYFIIFTMPFNPNKNRSIIRVQNVGIINVI